jgi:hypothetical protein
MKALTKPLSKALAKPLTKQVHPIHASASQWSRLLAQILKSSPYSAFYLVYLLGTDFSECLPATSSAPVLDHYIYILNFLIVNIIILWLVSFLFFIMISQFFYFFSQFFILKNDFWECLPATSSARRPCMRHLVVSWIVWYDMYISYHDPPYNSWDIHIIPYNSWIVWCDMYDSCIVWCDIYDSCIVWCDIYDSCIVWWVVSVSATSTCLLMCC